MYLVRVLRSKNPRTRNHRKSCGPTCCKLSRKHGCVRVTATRFESATRGIFARNLFFSGFAQTQDFESPSKLHISTLPKQGGAAGVGRSRTRARGSAAMKSGGNIQIFYISFLRVATPGGPLYLKIVLSSLAEASPRPKLRSVRICICRRRKPVVESLSPMYMSVARLVGNIYWLLRRRRSLHKLSVLCGVN